jgi:CBS-domain-containing membrane protein
MSSQEEGEAMRASDVIVRDVVTVTPDTEAEAAVKLC